jgi:hypothetical protein
MGSFGKLAIKLKFRQNASCSIAHTYCVVVNSRGGLSFGYHHVKLMLPLPQTLPNSMYLHPNKYALSYGYNYGTHPLPTRKKPRVG